MCGLIRWKIFCMEWWRDDGQLWRFKRDTVWSMLVNNVIIAIKCHQMALMSQFYSNQCRGARPSGRPRALCCKMKPPNWRRCEDWRLLAAPGSWLTLVQCHECHTLALGHWELYKVLSDLADLVVFLFLLCSIVIQTSHFIFHRGNSDPSILRPRYE